MHLLSNASAQIEMQWARLREAVQNISQGITMFDADLKLLVWNQRFLELLDFPESFGAIDTPFEKFVRYNVERGEYGPGDVEALVREHVERARHCEAHVFERERMNGVIIEVNGKPLPHGGFITTYTDITERKRNELALREAKSELEKRVEERTRALKDSEERFRDFAESASDWMWETDANLRFSYFSDRAAELLARPLETLLGKTRQELAAPEELERGTEKWRQHSADLVAHRPFRNFEYSVRRADGSLGIIRVSGKPILAADGAFCGYRGTGSDVTELAQAQNKLMEAEKLAALGRLVAGVAHEINTPIGIGVTAASFLREQTRDFAESYRAERLTRGEMQSYLRAAEEASDSLLTNLRRAASLVQSFKQVAVDQASDQRRRFNLKEYLDEILDSLRPQLKRTGHAINVDCPDDLELDSFPGAFSQIVTNLVMNSLQHGFDNIECGRADISVHRNDRGLRFAYSDNGCGMSEADAKRIFEPFFTTRRGQGGSGLGMNVVYNLVTQTLHGRIECRTSPGSGMHVDIHIPLDLERVDEQ
jgi:PAS domain S-box-containing protein